MFLRAIMSVFLTVLFFMPCAFAGKVELTTYYPAPTGEYAALHASNKLKVPVKTVAPGSAAESALTPGEIWLDSTP